MMKLIRQCDNLIKEGDIEFLEFDKNNRGKNIHIYPKVGYGCIVNRTSIKHSWMTLPIVELISNIEFKTKNNHYKIVSEKLGY